MSSWQNINTSNATVSELDEAYGIVLDPSPITTSGTVGLDLTAVTERTVCRLATTSNLNATYNNGTSGVGATLTNNGTQTALGIDSTFVDVGDRILVRAQSTQFQNGIYVVTVAGTSSTNWVLTRAIDFDGSITGAIATGVTVWVSEGGTYNSTVWMQTENGPFTVGTTSIVFSGYPGQSSITTVGAITAGTWEGGTIQISYGGTGITSISAQDILYGSASNVIGQISTANSSALITDSSGNPSWSQMLPVQVQGNITEVGTVSFGVWQGSHINVQYGGTGNSSTTAYGVICGGISSTANFQNAGTGLSGQVLTSTGNASLPTWQTPTVGTVTSVSGTTNQITVTSGTTTPVISLPSTVIVTTSVQAGNVQLGSSGDANAIVPTNTNGNIDLSPNSAGTGQVNINFSSSAVTGLAFNNIVQNRVITIWSNATNQHQFYGLGTNVGIFRYQIDQTGSNHVFYAGTSATSSNELARITGTGRLGVNNSSPTYTCDIGGTIRGDRVLGASNAPTAVAGTAAGTSGGASIVGSEVSGQITVTTSAGGTGTIFATVTLANAMPNANYGVVLFPANQSAAGNLALVGMFWATVTSSSTFNIYITAPTTGGGTYTWNYHIMGAN